MKEALSHETEESPLEEFISYQIQNKIFIVEPVFAKDDKETLGSVLLRLMESDI